MGPHLSQRAHRRGRADRSFVCSAQTARYLYLNQTVVSVSTKDAVKQLMCKWTY